MYVPVGGTAETIAWYEGKCAETKGFFGPFARASEKWYCDMADQLRKIRGVIDPPAPPEPPPGPPPELPPPEITRGTAYEEWFRQAEEAKEREKKYMVYGALALGALLLWRRGR